MNKNDLVKEAIHATTLSYVPYSKFKVGAAILMNNGQIIRGANIENSSYGLSMCAERNALFHARIQGYKAEDMIAMAVVGSTKEPISPCGACRQVMHELMMKNTPIYLSNLELKIKETTPEILLPYAFTSEDLTK